jgi:hypothetical protein
MAWFQEEGQQTNPSWLETHISSSWDTLCDTTGEILLS